MERVPAIAGWHWIKHGFALFRRQPGELSILFMLCCCLKLLIFVIPLAGVLLAGFILVPVFSQAFMVACLDIENGKRTHPRVLIDAFRSPALLRLAGLGACYLLASAIAGGITTLLDGGFLIQTMRDKLSNPDSAAMAAPNSPEELHMATSMLIWTGAYLLANLPLWFAGPLIAWRNMSVGKAIFYSFFSVMRAFKAFIVYALGWLMIASFVMFFILLILQVLQLDSYNAVAFLVIPIYMILTVITYCTYYASYAQIFGAPQVDPVE